MSEIQVGDRVSWRHKGKTRTGTVEQFNGWSNYAYVRPDAGHRHFVSKARLTRVEPGEDMTMDDRLIAGKLGTLERVASALADDLRRLPGNHRHARGLLLALVAALHNDSLESLAAVVAPWMRDEVARIDALTEAAAFDQLSAIVAEMALPGEDADELADERREWEKGRTDGLTDSTLPV